MWFGWFGWRVKSKGGRDGQGWRDGEMDGWARTTVTIGVHLHISCFTFVHTH